MTKSHMRRINVLSTLALAMFSAASAEDINCSTVKLNQWQVTYIRPAVFPTPSQTVKQHSRDNRPFSDFSACGFTLSSDANSFTIKATSKERLSEVLTLNGDKRILAYIANSYYLDGVGSFTFYVAFNTLSNTLFTDASAFIKDETYDEKQGYIPFKDNTVAYKVNDGPLTPLFFDGEVTLSPSFSDTDVLDVYIVDKLKYNSVPRFTLNLKENSATFWFKSTFPKQ
ncbi:hypothetical protein [Deinococcus aquaticus]|uniref:Uncharacterized protein n=1 Tax=Deinococcus aquaticus TaxID=328692 RepID=A0ABY7V073_9DEIO|nr:hypothetical protein [Deinococcus aquaticus]WDA58160.1 hypothetical protein M8445_12495 [Deinococcus aquaticus]